MMGEFREHIAVNFLVTDNLTSEKHIADLKRCLQYFHLEKKTYQLLWGSVMLGRNVFDDMVAEGADYMEKMYSESSGYFILSEKIGGLVWIFANE